MKKNENIITKILNVISIVGKDFQKTPDEVSELFAKMKYTMNSAKNGRSADINKSYLKSALAYTKMLFGTTPKLTEIIAKYFGSSTWQKLESSVVKGEIKLEDALVTLKKHLIKKIG